MSERRRWTDEDVERVASAIAVADDYDPNLSPHESWSVWTEHYRGLARAALSAALCPVEKEEGETDA